MILTHLEPAISVALIATIPPTIVALTGLIVSLKNHGNIRQLHVNLNSRLTELLKVTGTSSHATGRAEGIEAERSRKSNV